MAHETLELARVTVPAPWDHTLNTVEIVASAGTDVFGKSYWVRYIGHDAEWRCDAADLTRI